MLGREYRISAVHVTATQVVIGGGNCRRSESRDITDVTRPRDLRHSTLNGVLLAAEEVAISDWRKVSAYYLQGAYTGKLRRKT